MSTKNKKSKDPIIHRLSVQVSNRYFDAEGLCECEKKRRRQDVYDMYNSSPLRQYYDWSPIWIRDCDPALAHYDVPMSALAEFQKWMAYHPLNEWVYVSIYYTPDKSIKYADSQRRPHNN